MAVAKHKSSANTSPSHMLLAPVGAPYKDCSWKVSQRNAPGAISAIALIVRPVRPNVGFIVVGFFSDGEVADAIRLFSVLLLAIYVFELGKPVFLRDRRIPPRLPGSKPLSSLTRGSCH